MIPTMLRALIVLFLCTWVAVLLPAETMAAEGEQTARPSWNSTRPGLASTDDQIESPRPDEAEPLEGDRSPEPIPRVHSANRLRTPVSEVSMGSQTEVQVADGPPDYEIQYDNSPPSYYPPNESLSFEPGFAYPPLAPVLTETAWFDFEYLVWWSQGHYVPPLVTTGTVASLGVLRHPDTEILYGAKGLNGAANSGIRFDLGWWLAPEWAVEANLLWLAQMKDSYNISSTGDPLLARPFTNVVTGLEDSHIVAFPATVTGSLAINSTTRFKGAELLLRRTIHSRSDCRLNSGDRYSCRWDVLLGYRFNQLDDDVMINESLVTAGQTTIDLYDLFDSGNDFHGVDMGLNAVVRRNRWSLELLAKMALGNTKSTVLIDGATVTTAGGVVDNDLGGMLALSTNMGTYTQNSMAVIPELGVTLGFDITERFRATFGYTFIYWSTVARAGKQIDTNLNPSYFPNNGPPAGAAQPEFVFVTSDYWAQGLNFGLELHF